MVRESRKRGGRRRCEVLRNTGDTGVRELREGYEVKRAGRAKKGGKEK